MISLLLATPTATTQHDWLPQFINILDLIFTSISIVFSGAAAFLIWKFPQNSSPVSNSIKWLSFWLCLGFFTLMFNDGISNRAGCVIVASLSHIFMFAAFCRMSALAFTYYFLLVRRLDIETDSQIQKIITINSILWPILFSIISFSLDAYGKDQSGDCWLRTEDLQMWLWRIPIGVILIVNFILFISVVIHVNKSFQNAMFDRQTRLKHEFRIIFILFFTLGLSWVSGFLSKLVETLHGSQTLFSVLMIIFLFSAGLIGPLLFFNYAWTPEYRASVKQHGIWPPWKQIAVTVDYSPLH